MEVSSIVEKNEFNLGEYISLDSYTLALSSYYLFSFSDEDAGVEEWEAELEGELNEFEVVSSKDGNEDPTDDMTETEIQEMLDAEDGTSSTDSLKRK